MTLTPAGELMVRFGVESNAEQAAMWAGMTPRAREIAVERAALWPPRKNPRHPPPAWLWNVLRTAESLAAAEQLAERHLSATVNAGDVPVNEPAFGVNAGGDAATAERQSMHRQDEQARDRRAAGEVRGVARRGSSWSRIRPWLLGAVAVGAGALLAHRGGRG